jgi:hypothetical protein
MAGARPVDSVAAIPYKQIIMAPRSFVARRLRPLRSAASSLYC